MYTLTIDGPLEIQGLLQQQQQEGLGLPPSAGYLSPAMSTNTSALPPLPGSDYHEKEDWKDDLFYGQ